MQKARLSVIGGDIGASEVTLELPAIIGRGAEAALPLNSSLISRRHCELFSRDGAVWVRDLGSLNGTFVGREKISEHVLVTGDLLTVGTVTFRSVAEDHELTDSTVDGRTTSVGLFGEGDTVPCGNGANAQDGPDEDEDDVLAFHESFHRPEPQERTTLKLS